MVGVPILGGATHRIKAKGEKEGCLPVEKRGSEAALITAVQLLRCSSQPRHNQSSPQLCHLLVRGGARI